jgi:hypothetical protein
MGVGDERRGSVVEGRRGARLPRRGDADALDFLAGYLSGVAAWGEVEVETIIAAVLETGRHIPGAPGADEIHAPEYADCLADLIGDPVLDPATAEKLGNRIWGRFSTRLPNGARVRQLGFEPRRARVEVEGLNGERCTCMIRTHRDAQEVAAMALRWDRGEPTRRDLALCAAQRGEATEVGR